MTNYPTSFISYSWEDDEHKKWVKELASRLRDDGVNVILDQWEVIPGDQLPRFMENSISKVDYVLIICTPKYKIKSDNREGGVGYEGDIITGEVFQKQNNRKFIPILKKGNWKESSPTFIMGKYYVDLRNITDFESNYNDLITTILNRREVAPPIGQYQQSKSTMQVFKEDEHSIMPEIKIKGILVDEIGKPLNDGTQGSSLYRIPFELNMRPDNLWAELFRHTWDLPPQCTTGHRPGIGFVSGNKIILEKTKIEEVKEIHKNTLKLVVETVNKQYTEIKLKEKIKKEKEEQERIRQHQKIMNIANDIKF